MKENIGAPAGANKFSAQSVAIADRKKLSVTGVNRVDCATETEISLTTCMGRLLVAGSALKITKFDESDGNLSLTGNIDGVKYAAAKTPLIKRIFK